VPIDTNDPVQKAALELVVAIEDAVSAQFAGINAKLDDILAIIAPSQPGAKITIGTPQDKPL